MREKTPAQKRLFIIRLIVTAVLTLVVAFAVLTPILWSWQVKTEGRLVLAQAKNVELSLRTTTIDAYGANETIYDQTAEEGLKKEYIEEIKRRSGVEGDIYLTRWNTKYNRAQAFQYTTGKFVVNYTYDFTTESASWSVDYVMHVLDY